MLPLIFMLGVLWTTVYYKIMLKLYVSLEMLKQIGPTLYVLPPQKKQSQTLNKLNILKFNGVYGKNFNI